MANRQTKRERKALAKQRRLEEMRRAARRRRLQKIYSLVSVLVLIAAVAGLVWLSGKGERDRIASINTLAGPAGCNTVQKPSFRGREHIEPPATGDFSSVPPTSGSHYNAADPPSPTFTGVHTEPIQNESQVHNLEHGHIGLQYTDGLKKEVRDMLTEIGTAEATKEWVFVAPYPAMAPTQLAITTWTRLIKCDAPTDPVKVRALIDKVIGLYRGKAPETVPGTPREDAGSEGTPPPTGSPGQGEGETGQTAEPTGSPAETTAPSPTAPVDTTAPSPTSPTGGSPTG